MIHYETETDCVEWLNCLNLYPIYRNLNSEIECFKKILSNTVTAGGTRFLATKRSNYRCAFCCKLNFVLMHNLNFYFHFCVCVIVQEYTIIVILLTKMTILITHKVSV